jgi:sulfate transport system ATP-binding protein
MTEAAGLSIRGVSRRFGALAALDNVSLEVAPGEFLALLGPSGSGKTTLLRTIAGLERPEAGTILADGRDFLAMTPRERRVGLVFQHYALFRHMKVADNVAFGLKVRPARQRPPKREIAERVETLLKLVQLDGLGKRYPAQLSGGQRQRVALARALAIEPRVLLLDEPFGALDAKVRKELRVWLRELHDLTGVTTVFVTHDQEEAMQMADRVAVLRAGQIEQVGTPQALEQAPASAFVFDFLGDANVIDCLVDGDTARIGDFNAAAENRSGLKGPAVARFRPYETDIAGEDGAGIPVRIVAVAPRGRLVRIEARTVDGMRLEALAPRDGFSGEVGSTVRFRPGRVYVFPAE